MLGATSAKMMLKEVDRWGRDGWTNGHKERVHVVEELRELDAEELDQVVET